MSLPEPTGPPGEAVLQVRDLVKHFAVRTPSGRGTVRAVDGVSLSVDAGETVALVGESGCGKTTVGRTIMRFEDPTSGSVTFDGQDLATLSQRELRRERRGMQFVFQDPYQSLPGRKPVGAIVSEPLEIHRVGDRRARRRRVGELLDMVGLGAGAANRYPHQFSGGQRQRIGLARALALQPKLLVLDEPVSALDVSVQAQVVNLLTRLQAELGVAYLFVAHDLAVVRHVSHRIAVMYLGKIMEYGDAQTIFTAPAHPYTRALLSAVPVPDPRSPRTPQVLAGEVPSALHPPSGCVFRTRCPLATERCAVEVPALQNRVTDDVQVACHYAGAAAAAAVPTPSTETAISD